MSEQKPPQPKAKLKSISAEELVEVKTRHYRLIRTRKEVEAQAVRDLAKLVSGLGMVTEQRDQAVLLNKALRKENASLAEVSNKLAAEVEKLRAEKAALEAVLEEKTRPVQAEPPMAGICQKCQHDGPEWHNNPSKVCSKEGCPCLSFKSASV